MNTRIIPFGFSYQTVAKINSWATAILYFSTIISITISILGYFNQLPILRNILIVGNILLVCCYVFLDNRATYIFTRVEMRRRLDWLDNSFNTNFSGKKSKDYFTNDDLSPGFYKLAVNCFENSHHTHFIVSKMLPRIIVETIIVISIFVTSAAIGNKEVVRLFFELALPALLLQKLIKAVFFSSRMTEVHDRFKNLFNDLMSIQFDLKTAEALKDIIEYEAALSWASTPLNSNVFLKHQQKLANEWDEMKRDYKIKV